MRQRIVVDTNIYVSRLIREQSTPGRAVARAWKEGITLVSAATLAEIGDVLRRPEIGRFVQPEKVEPYLAQIRSVALFIANPRVIRACRDSRDDKFLEVAVHGRADLILTGDQDLLALDPFHGIRILTPADYLARE